jgi:hypothetical protein
LKIKKIDFSIRDGLREFYRNSFVGLGEAVSRYIRNANVQYSWIMPDKWPVFKKSDTLFVFGSGPSINDITKDQWDIIKANDSFGLNFAFLTYYPMTYYYIGYYPTFKEDLKREPGHNVHNILAAFDEKVRALFKDCLWFIPPKALFRLAHPRFFPELFPLNVKLALFSPPASICLEKDRPFNVEDFQNSLLYRGVMGNGLHLADLLKYKKIVLLGVDLQTHRHFYDDHVIMKEISERYNKKIKEKTGGVFESMFPVGNKYRTIEEYYYSISELYFRPKGVSLYVGNQNNILSPRIPLYPEFI